MKKIFRGALQMIRDLIFYCIESVIPVSYAQSKSKESCAQKSIIERASLKTDNTVYAKLGIEVSDIKNARKKGEKIGGESKGGKR